MILIRAEPWFEDQKTGWDGTCSETDWEGSGEIN